MPYSNESNLVLLTRGMVNICPQLNFVAVLHNC